MNISIDKNEVLNSGAFILNSEKSIYTPFINQNIFLTQEGSITLKVQILKIIKECKEVLKICSFIITDEEIFEALLDKAKNTDCAIFFLTQLDENKLKSLISLKDFITEEEITGDSGNIHINYIKELYDCGVHVRASKSAHSKFIIKDRNVGLLMSANLTMPSLSFNTESGVYLDTISTIELDRLFDVIFQSGTNYKGFLGTKKKNKMLVVENKIDIRREYLPEFKKSNLRYTYETESNSLLEEIIGIIDSAEEYIYLSSYSIVQVQALNGFMDSLHSAIKRRVKITVFCRGMNYRNDHLKGCSLLREAGCTIYADIFNHSKGIINEKKGMIFTANIDGKHGLHSGFEVGYILDENQRNELLSFNKNLIDSAFYYYCKTPTREQLINTYIEYEKKRGINAPIFPETLTITVKKDSYIDLTKITGEIFFYGRLGEEEFFITGDNYYNCNFKEGYFHIGVSVSPKYNIEKYIVKSKNINFKK